MPLSIALHTSICLVNPFAIKSKQSKFASLESEIGRQSSGLSRLASWCPQFIAVYLLLFFLLDFEKIFNLASWSLIGAVKSAGVGLGGVKVTKFIPTETW